MNEPTPQPDWSLCDGAGMSIEAMRVFGIWEKEELKHMFNQRMDRLLDEAVATVDGQGGVC